MRTESWTPKRPTFRPHPHPGICHDYGLGPSLIPYEALNIDLNIIGFIYVYTLITYYRWYMQPLSTKNRPDYRDCLHSAVCSHGTFRLSCYTPISTPESIRL